MPLCVLSLESALCALIAGFCLGFGWTLATWLVNRILRSA